MREVRRNLTGGLVTIAGYAYMTVLLICMVPSVFGYQKYIVRSGSMEPELPVGSCVFVKEAEAHEITAGDIISYSMADAQTVITHRVIQCGPSAGSYRTKGDANKLEDGNDVVYSQILGRVRFCIPFLGYFLAIHNIPGIKICGIALLLSAASVYMYHGERKETGR